MEELGEEMLKLRKARPAAPHQPSALNKAIDALTSQEPRTKDSSHEATGGVRWTKAWCC
jgi:hypothetical protein